MRDSTFNNEKGLGMVEIIFSILLVGLAAGGIASHTILALKLSSRLELSQAAHALALSKAEQLSAINTSQLNSSYDLVETDLSAAGHPRITFSRTTTISANSDGTKTVNVEVSTENSPQEVSTEYITRWAPWE